jgi:hypothetical protein
MNSKFRETTLFVLLILAGCNRAPKSNRIGAIEEILRDLVIVLERGICFGTCPAYKLTISASSSVEFEGRHYVKKKGVVRATISREQIKHLVAEIEKVKFFKLRDRYVNKEDGCSAQVVDTPNVKTSITIAGKTKSIEHQHGCEGPLVIERLTVLENRIDEVVNASQWFDESNR